MDTEIKEKREAFKKRMEARTGQPLDKPFDFKEYRRMSPEELNHRAEVMNAKALTDGTIR